MMQVLFTYWNVTKREHCLLSPVFYHETFTRPQRLLCIIALLMGLMAINATVQSHPGMLQEAQEYIIPGVLSGLLLYPVYCGLILMFNMRPASVKRKLIKRHYPTHEVDLVAQQRKKL